MTETARHKQIIEKLRQERDELRLQMRLGKAEFKDEWEELEHKWEKLEARMSGAAEEAKEASKEVGAAFGVLADELGEAYRRIRHRLG
jgi:seryl-tRNA synthetase